MSGAGWFFLGVLAGTVVFAILLAIANRRKLPTGPPASSSSSSSAEADSPSTEEADNPGSPLIVKRKPRNRTMWGDV